MPTGLEEASAILTFVQVGFSLARTFTTLIGEYREAPDELATLANAIVDTLAHIETIKRLLEENETTHGWNANGIDLATSCLQEAERLVKRIVTLLRKSGADIPPNDRIGPEDISISVLRRVAWSRFTGRIGKINESLAATRQKMLLILTLYRAFTVDSQEQQRLARDRVIVLVRGRQVQRARRKCPGQHSNTPNNTRRAIGNEQEERSVFEEPTSSIGTSQEIQDENGPETTTKAVSPLLDRLDGSDEAANALCSDNSRDHHNPDAHASCGAAESPLQEMQEASASPDESTKAANSPSVSPANRPADDESTPTAVEGQSDLSVNQEQKCPPNSDEAKIENLIATACAMDDAVLLQFGEAFNPPLTADQVRRLLQKAPSMTKEVGNNDDHDHDDSNMSHQRNLSPSRDYLPQVHTDANEDITGAPRAESAATNRNRTAAEVTTRGFFRSFLGRLANRKRVAVQPLSRTSESNASFCSSTTDESTVKVQRFIHMSKLWRIGDWAFSKIDGFQTSFLAPAKFVSLLVTLAVEGCTIVPAHLSRDELNRLLWHAAASECGPNASLTSQIYASLPTVTHRMIDRLLRQLDSRGHEIIYAEVMGVRPSKTERMIRRKHLNSGASLMENRILLVLTEREEARNLAEINGDQQEHQSMPVGVPTNQDQVEPGSPVNVYRVNDEPNHGNTLREMMRAEEMEKMKRQKEYEEDEKTKRKGEEKEKRKRERELGKEEKQKKIEEEEKEQEKMRREDEMENDEEEEVFGNILGLGDDELVQRLLETYTNTRPS